jgi:hypothetical protein
MPCHLILVHLETGKITGEWVGTCSQKPVAPEQYVLVDVTEGNWALGQLSTSGYKYADGTIVVDPTIPATISRAAFVMLFSSAQRAAIRAYRKANNDDQIEDFYELLELAGDTVSLGHPLILAGLQLLVSKGLITQPEAARILSGQRPA